MRKYGPTWIPSNFLALPEEQCRLDNSKVVLVPVPYDSTTSFKSGSRHGPRAIIEASYNLEDYDPELDVDVAQLGIHTSPSLEPHMDGPLHMIQRVRNSVHPFLQQGKLLALIGGEHSISIGHVQALVEYHSDLSVLYLDAHADLRDEYMGTRWGHASVARRISELCPLVQVGIRSLSEEEMKFIRDNKVNAFFWPSEDGSEEAARTDWPAKTEWNVEDIIAVLSSNVYVSVDLDVFDPSIMSAVGTPEPGGMGWQQVMSLLRAVAEERHIVGFDVTELSPGEGPTSCSYTAAKLVYKLIAYASLLPRAGDKLQDSRPKPRGRGRRGKASALSAWTEALAKDLGRKSREV